MKESLYLTAACLVTWAAGPVQANRVDGFTEPYRTVEVATTEVGIITALKVREGDSVSRGQIVATLDDEVQQALLAIAAKNLELKGRIESALAERELRAQRLEKLQSLQRAGHARQEEVERARADLSIADAQVLAAQEEIAIRQLEYNKTAIQLERRLIRSPVDGIISNLHKESGEFVAPTDPHILNIVQLDQLLAVFSVPTPQAEQIEVGMTFEVSVGATVTRGTVERISPLTDAESDTVRIKLRLPNQDHAFRSGQRCALLLSEAAAAEGSQP